MKSSNSTSQVSAALQPSSFVDWHRTADDLPSLMAHRGASTEQAENTLVNFRAARVAGTHVIEGGGVRTTADGELDTLHDSTVARISDSRVTVDAFTLAELRGIRLRDPRADNVGACENRGSNKYFKFFLGLLYTLSSAQ